MKVKQILFLFSFSLILLSSFSVEAQRKHNSMDRLEELNLTAEQEKELEALKADFKEKMKQLKADETADHSAWKTLKEEKKAAFKKILTTEQLAQLETIKTEKKAEHAERRKEGRAYHKENVLPILKIQRAKLEQKMDAEDIATINKIRADLKTKKAAHKAEKGGKERRHKRKRGHHAKGKHRDHLDEATRNQLTAIAEKYSADIAELEAEIAPQIEQWKRDHEAKKKAHQEEMSEERRAKMEARKEKHKQAHADREEQKTEHKRIKFLLLDPDTKEASSQQAISNNSLHEVKVYPNPSAAMQTIDFTVKEAGMVTIDIVDKSGNIIKSVSSQEMSVGQNSVQVDVSDLKGYVFYYRIKDASGASSTKFLVKQ